jgi:hypothetical protein
MRKRSRRIEMASWEVGRLGGWEVGVGGNAMDQKRLPHHIHHANPKQISHTTIKQTTRNTSQYNPNVAGWGSLATHCYTRNNHDSMNNTWQR